MFSLLLIFFVIPFAASAQDSSKDGDYVPLILGDNVFSLLYPSKWTFDKDSAANGTFVFASDLSILQRKPDQPYAKGDIVVALDLLVTNKALTSDDGLEVTLKQFLDTTRYGKDNKSLTTFDPSVVSFMPAVDGTPTIATATYTDAGRSDGMIYLWRINERVLGIVTVNTAVGEIALQEPDVLLFIQSVHFNATPEEFAKLVQQGSGS
jgi:hypothetical protein